MYWALASHVFRVQHTNVVDTLPLVEPSIAQSLSAAVDRPCLYPDRIRVAIDSTKGTVTFHDTDPTLAFTETNLIPLAQQCQDCLLKIQPVDSNPLLSPSLQTLWYQHAASPSGTTFALLVSLNLLESTIRGSQGRVLLKTLLANDELPNANILRCLLLPSGINLRNLLWHGFVGDGCCLRPWLALVLLLLCSANKRGEEDDSNVQNNSQNNSTTSPLSVSAPTSTHPLLRQARLPSRRCATWIGCLDASGEKLFATTIQQQEQQKRLSNDAEKIASTLFESSFHSLWEYSCCSLHTNQQPILTSIVWTVLLEHALRRLWCTHNHRPDASQARSGSMYVTLDGHGQRDQHDVVLLPTVGVHPNQTMNQLLPVLGAPLLSLLADLFISGAGGPNVRAALAHGMYDDAVERELLMVRFSKDHIHHDTQEHAALRNVLLLLLHTLADQVQGHGTGELLKEYRPLFSYTATTNDALDDLLAELSSLQNATIDFPPMETAPPLPATSINTLRERKSSLGRFFADPTRINHHEWTIGDFLAEIPMNQDLGTKTAARTLLLDLLEAVQDFSHALRQKSTSTSSNSTKQLRRIQSKARYLVIVYSFSIHVALLHLESRETSAEELVKLVARTRMMVSTVATFILPNADRAYKAVNVYANSKIAKAAIEMIALGGQKASSALPTDYDGGSSVG